MDSGRLAAVCARHPQEEFRLLVRFAKKKTAPLKRTYANLGSTKIAGWKILDLIFDGVFSRMKDRDVQMFHRRRFVV